ncbi:helix-turn-helix domain-containing protein [Phyllobacterium myrsinacearum]|uniref:helix-turn-helix domain-containing protein n=1 Tax=Phyllobacterium myrsinacearum TaxID=28101 RepID=UPI0032B2B99D
MPHEKNPITADQCRAARALTNMSQEDLAKAAKVGLSTVRNFETGRSQINAHSTG